MSEVILNMLLLTPDEKREFETIAPDAEHLYCQGRDADEEQLANATVILGWPRPEILCKAEKLKWIQTMWAGSEEYTGEGVLPHGVILTASNGVNCKGVAEYMLACLLALCRRITYYRDLQHQHCWQHGDAYGNTAKTVIGSTVLVVGAGNIGSNFAELCRGMGAHTIGVKRTVNGPVEGFDELYEVEQLERLLPIADVVALCMPHNEQTVGLINEKRLRLMRNDAILINAGRGSVIDQEALVRLMRAGKLWGAALDVMLPEPLPDDHPLWEVPNLLITPHVAGAMRIDITRRRAVELAEENLRRYVNGEKLCNIVRR